MRDNELKKVYHRLCRKKSGALNDTEPCFRAFKAGYEFALGNFEPMATGEMSPGRMLARMVEEANKIDGGA